MASACAPPAACTSRTPSSAHAASTDGCGSPWFAACGGDATAIEATPATWAGTMFITTELGYATRPPGTYTPARPTGENRPVTVSPAMTWVVVSGGSCAPCTRLVRLTASSRAALTWGPRPARASSRAAGGTRVVARSTPSKRAVYSRTAAAPRFRTSSQIGRTSATADSTSVVARGRTPDSSVRLRLAGPRPRMSMRRSSVLGSSVLGSSVLGSSVLGSSVRESTRLVYGECSLAGPTAAVLGQQDDERGQPR